MFVFQKDKHVGCRNVVPWLIPSATDSGLSRADSAHVPGIACAGVVSLAGGIIVYLNAACMICRCYTTYLYQHKYNPHLLLVP